MNRKKTCFFISPIAKEGSEERKRSDDVLNFIIAPVVEKLGYEVIRADKIAKSGMITSQVIQHVFDAHLVIADLAFRNPNVFYELALRHAIRKPFVQLIEEGGTIPFDVAGLRAIHLDHTNLGSADRAKQELTKQIEAIHEDPSDVESPVTQAIDVQRLKQSGGPVEEYLAAMMDMLSDLKGQFAQLRSDVEPSPTEEPSSLEKVAKRVRDDQVMAPTLDLMEALRKSLHNAEPKKDKRKRHVLRRGKNKQQ